MIRTSSPGDHIERYTIDRKLTEGGMAEVYLAHHAVDGFAEPVIIKSLLPGFVDNRDFVAMMLNEGRIAKRLSHPNVVRVEDCIEVGGRPFIIMEYLDGKTLREIVQRSLALHRTLSLGFICRAVAEVLAGLEHAHELADDDGLPLGLVHRDVSLSNAIVTWPGRVALIDFGIAKETGSDNDDLTRAGQVKGKSAYMSPEQIKREPIDRRSDLFSVGIVLWEMLTQRRLFARRTEVDSMTAICCHDSAPPSTIAPELPAALDRICAKALARDRAARYQTAAEMAAELEEVIADEQLPATAADLRAELAALFPEESASSAWPALYADDEERLTTVTPPPLFEDRAAVQERSRAATTTMTTTLRSVDISLLNQRLPGPSVYDNMYERRLSVGQQVRLGVFVALCSLVVFVVLLQLWPGVHR